MRVTRRSALQLASGLAVGSLAPPTLARAAAPAAPGEIESYGLSIFGDLAEPADFKHFAYVNPNAPKAGELSIQIKNTIGNQNFDTFDTFNIYVLRGDGAAGMDATFDSLMAGSADEPDAVYGLLAKSVRYTPDKLLYKFLLRPEARFHDGSRVSAGDVAFSINILKTKGHPLFQLLLRDVAAAEADGDEVAIVRFSPRRSRDAHLFVAGLPVFSQEWWRGRHFEAPTLEAPLGSGPYKLADFQQGSYVAFQLVRDYWAANLPVNVGQNNFDRIRYTYYRDRTPAFEDFKAGRLNYEEEYTAKFWATEYNFPAVKDGRVKRIELHDGAPHAIQGWYFNLRRPQFADRRIRDAINYAFDFQWTNKNIMYSMYKRLVSFFSTPETEAKGKPGPAELKLLDPWRGKVPNEVFGDPWIPPVSDGSGEDRKLLRHAYGLLMAAGCKRSGTRLLLPDGTPLAFEFLNSTSALEPHLEPFQANLRRLGIVTTSRIVDAAQYKNRTDSFDFDIIVMATGGSLTPGDDLRNLYSSRAAHTPGSQNMAGIASPAVDALIDVIANAQSRADLDVGCRALDRVLRAGRYWVPMWYRNVSLIAYWDVFDRPSTMPRYATGAPGDWWWDSEKAARIGVKS